MITNFLCKLNLAVFDSECSILLSAMHVSRVYVHVVYTRLLTVRLHATRGIAKDFLTVRLSVCLYVWKHVHCDKTNKMLSYRTETALQGASLSFGQKWKTGTERQ